MYTVYIHVHAGVFINEELYIPIIIHVHMKFSNNNSLHCMFHLVLIGHVSLSVCVYTPQPTDYYDDQVKQEEEAGNVCMVSAWSLAHATHYY